MSESQFHVTEVSPSYWRIRFQNGAVNLVDPDTVDELADLVTRLESAPALTVAVFESGNPDFFMAHWDLLSDRARVAGMAPGRTGLHPYLDNFVRLSRVPLLTISALRGRARGAGSEFVLATDVRFAGDRAVLGQFEVGVGAVPGGGPMARLTRLVGRGRAMEILLGGDDFPAALAAEYGYVNRVVPDAELDGFVDRFARRVAAFDKVAVREIKQFIDAASLPADAEFGPGLAAFFRTAGRPEQAHRVASLFEQGLQQPDGIELDLGARLADLPAA
jgi:enoyl-CoA hydratase/carnithine racemase